MTALVQQLVRRLAMLPVPLHKVPISSFPPFRGLLGVLGGAFLSDRFVPRDHREDLRRASGQLGSTGQERRRRMAQSLKAIRRKVLTTEQNGRKTKENKMKKEVEKAITRLPEVLDEGWGGSRCYGEVWLVYSVR